MGLFQMPRGSDEEMKIEDQPPPQTNEEPAIWSLVIADMRDRDKTGFQRYGTRLQPFNGRDALVDAYQEALDLVVYLRQAIYERDAIRETVASLIEMDDNVAGVGDPYYAESYNGFLENLRKMVPIINPKRKQDRVDWSNVVVDEGDEAP